MSAPAAILQAQAKYTGGRDFLQDLLAHATHGIVAATPEVFAMGRGVRASAPDRLLYNIRFSFGRAEQDCWLVWSAAGPLRALLALLPYELPLIAFHRREDRQLRVYPLPRLRELAEGIRYVRA